MDTIILRKTTVEDLDSLFVFQLDTDASYLAAFVSNNTHDKEAYIKKHSVHLTEPTNNTQTVFLNNLIIGSIAKFEINNDAEITYWIDKAYWGKGLATKILNKFLTIEKCRPLFGRVAFDNIGSQKVLEKNGFIKVATDRGYAYARQTEIEEFIYKINA